MIFMRYTTIRHFAVPPALQSLNQTTAQVAITIISNCHLLQNHKYSMNIILSCLIRRHKTDMLGK